MPAAVGMFTDAELASIRLLTGVDVIDVGCHCGWRGKSSELEKRIGARLCPKCTAAVLLSGLQANEVSGSSNLQGTTP